MSKGRKQATPALEVAERAGVAYAVHSYEHDPAHESYGLEAAEKLGVDPARVFKTLVVSTGSKDLAVAVVPVEGHLDLKAMAAAIGVKAVEMADPPTAERTTGYVVGAISPLGQKRRLPTVIDGSAEAHATVNVSAGRRGMEIELAPQDLLRLTGGAFAPVVRW